MVKQQMSSNFKAQLKKHEIMCHMKKLQLKKVLLVKGVKSSRMSFFRGVKVRVDEKWTWGKGG